MLIMTEFIFIIAFLIVFAIGMCSGIIIEQKEHSREIEKATMHCDDWCMENCKKWNECFSKNRYPVDAMETLVSYCVKCPLAELELIKEKMNR